MSVSSEQFLRRINLIAYRVGGQTQLAGVGTPNVTPIDNGIDLSQLRIKFQVKRSSGQTPNTADIRIYNVTKEVALSLLTFTPVTAENGLLVTQGQVVLQAGYESNFGIIFQGNIKQVLVGRESATDTYVDIVAGDGLQAYNNAIVNTTLAAGHTQTDQLNAIVRSTTANGGVTLGTPGALPTGRGLRGKVLYGNAKNYLRYIAQNSNQSWSIQNEQITLIPLKSFLPGERVVLTSKTGLIGTPQQTIEGVNVKCLINPLIKIGGSIDISEATVENLKVDLNNPDSNVNSAAPLTADGSYFVLALEHTGDTRGVEWYTTLICLNRDVSTNPINSVQPGFG